jgi:hypothetical protein
MPSAYDKIPENMGFVFVVIPLEMRFFQLFYEIFPGVMA